MLHQATFNNHVGCMMVLLDRYGRTPIPVATSTDPRCSEMELLVDARKRDGSTALHLCAVRGLENAARTLLSFKGRRDIRNCGEVWGKWGCRQPHAVLIATPCTHFLFLQPVIRRFLLPTSATPTAWAPS